MLKLLFFCQRIILKIEFIIHAFLIHIEKKKLGYCGKNVILKYPIKLNSNIFLEDDVYIYGNARFIMRSNNEQFIMKKKSGASQGLTVITGKHGHKVGFWSNDLMKTGKFNTHSTILIEEDVQIGANVTLLPNIKIGRGAQIGACSVVTRNIPPYAIAAGNPAKVIKFIFTPEEILKHESILYPENERFSLEELKAMQQV